MTVDKSTLPRNLGIMATTARKDLPGIEITLSRGGTLLLDKIDFEAPYYIDEGVRLYRDYLTASIEMYVIDATPIGYTDTPSFGVTQRGKATVLRFQVTED